MCSLTIFTPTYNRAEYLKVCYQHLVSQNNMDFVWQVVDDGSIDGTRELIQSFIDENKIKIQYYRKENGGKASAINYSLRVTDTPLWVCLDSDDYLLDGGVDKILQASEGIMADDRVCGAFCVRSDKHGNPMKGIDLPENIKYATQFDIRYKYKVEPEYVQVYKTEIIKEYQFPVFEGERFVTESWMQDQIDQKYVFKIFHDPVMVCEYLPDGLTNNYYKLIKNNPLGFLEFYGQRTVLCNLIKPKITAAIMYNAVYKLINDKNIPRKKNWAIWLTSFVGKFMKQKKFKEE